MIMKKISLALAISFLFCAVIFSAPFGLSMEMTLKEVEDACDGERPERLSDDDRYFIKPAKSHSRFKTYIAWIDDEYGLYSIRGISDDIATDKLWKGTEKCILCFQR